MPRHPSQLYEAALEGMILFIVLINLIYKKSMNTGIVSALFMVLYGLFRMVIEIFREPDVQIGYLFNLFSMGSILSFVMILAGLLILKKAKNNDFSQ
jgi:phosphatidylglycerol:prolipoprotein diacylglycerol transferase